jgi:hypothetical protein
MSFEGVYVHILQRKWSIFLPSQIFCHLKSVNTLLDDSKQYMLNWIKMQYILHWTEKQYILHRIKMQYILHCIEKQYILHRIKMQYILHCIEM